MASWILVPCLVSLRGEFNALSPGRDKGADGSIGDLAHQQESSDHNPDETGRTPFEDADSINEVHAIDIDSTGPWPTGHSLDDSVEKIRLNHLHGRDDRLQNIIWRGRVASRSWGWTWQDRAGIGHFDHAHFSARYTTAQESDTSPWGVLEDDMALTDADADVILNRLAVRLKSQGRLAAPTDELVLQMRSIPWTYQGGGLQGATSTLDALADGQAVATKLDAVIEAIKTAGVTLSEAQVTAIGDAVGNAANQALQRVVSKLERAGSALTQ